MTPSFKNTTNPLLKKPNAFLSSGELDITPELVDYFRKNPNDLDLLLDKEDFQVSFLYFFFVLGLILTIGARVFIYFFADNWGQFVNTVILDVLSELGIAIFGGAITAYLLEYLKDKQYQKNLRLRTAIKAQIEKGN